MYFTPLPHICTSSPPCFFLTFFCLLLLFLSPPAVSNLPCPILLLCFSSCLSPSSPLFSQPSSFSLLWWSGKHNTPLSHQQTRHSNRSDCDRLYIKERTRRGKIEGWEGSRERRQRGGRKRCWNLPAWWKILWGKQQALLSEKISRSVLIWGWV